MEFTFITEETPLGEIFFSGQSTIYEGLTILFSSAQILLTDSRAGTGTFESRIPACCTANVCDANPQTANFDNQNMSQSKSGQTLVSAVSNFYVAAATGQLRPNAPPMFKTYQQMMDWRQRQNRR